VPEAPEPNAAQTHHWNVEAGPSWVQNEQKLDAMLEQFLARLMEVAEPKDGERALDIGCGCGATTIALAQLVGPAGTVLGIDVSAPMLHRARERIDALALANVTLEQADAQRTAIPPVHQVAISRFGVMFFDDPVAAFTNIRRGLRDDGRLTFVCWQELGRNPWMKVPIDAVLPFVTPPPPVDPHAPGPYAFADRDRTQRILVAAGFSATSIDPFEGELTLGGTASVDAAVDFATQTGALRALLGSVDDATRAAAVDAVRGAVTPYAGPDGVRIGFAAWIVSASHGDVKGQE
jgi:SAM-dependent methyltransferase